MMPFLLFCTANFEPEVIETFISNTTRAVCAIPQQWLLVRSPQEPITGPSLSNAQQWSPEKWPNKSPAPIIRPFKTGFLDASLDTLSKFVREHSVGEDKDSVSFDLDLRASRDQFVVLDARTAKDGTALVYQHHSRMPPEAYEEDEDAWDNDALIEEWVEWRMRPWPISMWMMSYEQVFDYADFEISRGTYIDKTGVLQLPWYEHDSRELPGLADEEKAPWGPESSQNQLDERWKFPESPFVDLIDAGLIKVYPVTGERKLEDVAV